MVWWWWKVGCTMGLSGCGTVWNPVSTLSLSVFQKVPAMEEMVTWPGRYLSASAQHCESQAGALGAGSQFRNTANQRHAVL